MSAMNAVENGIKRRIRNFCYYRRYEFYEWCVSQVGEGALSKLAADYISMDFDQRKSARKQI
jgi:hypothetical protein